MMRSYLSAPRLEVDDTWRFRHSALPSEIGGASRDRTDDLIVANDALSQLSYSPTGTMGLLVAPSFYQRFLIHTKRRAE